MNFKKENENDKRKFISPFERVTNERTSYLLPELIEMQRESFSSFLENGILEEFSKINPVRSPTGDLSLIFYPKEYKLTPPFFNIQESILQGKTYSSKLYIPTRISWSEDFKKLQEKNFPKPPIKEGKRASENILNTKKGNRLQLLKTSPNKKFEKGEEKGNTVLNKKRSFSFSKKRNSLDSSISTSVNSKSFLKVEKKPVEREIKRPYIKNWTLKCWILVGNLPLMTKRGHFIINGSPRVLVSQMTRCAGVYFHEKWRGMGSQKKRICYADFISRRGAWLRIEVDKSKELFVRLKRTPKIPLDIFQEGFKSFERGKSKGYPAILEDLNLKKGGKFLDNSLDSQQRTQKRSGFRKDSSNVQRISLFLGKKAGLTLYYEYPVLAANECDLNSPELLLALQQNPWTWGEKNYKRILRFAFDGKERISSTPFNKKFEKSKRLEEFLNRFSIIRDLGVKRPEMKLGDGFLTPPNFSSEIVNGKAPFSESDQILKYGAFKLSGDFGKQKNEFSWKRVGNENEKKKSKKPKKFEIDFKNIDFLDRNDAVFDQGDKIEEKKQGKGFKTSKDIKGVERLLEENWKGKERMDKPSTKTKKKKSGSEASIAFTSILDGCILDAYDGKGKGKLGIEYHPSRFKNMGKRRLIKNLVDTNVLIDLFQEIQDSGAKNEFSSLFSSETGKNYDLVATGALQFIYQKFKNPRSYDLGKVGRKRINEKLQISTYSDQLDSKDIEFASLYLHRLEKNEVLPDDIDNLKNRRIRSAGELLQSQLETGVYRLERFILSRLEVPLLVNSFSSSSSTLPHVSPPLPSIRSLVTTKALNGAIREFFGSNPLSQYMDQTNPLAEVTHKRRISSLGPGGISRDTAGMAIRGIHSTHYGRICPIETPEGKNAGLVNSLTLFGRGTRSGFLETPYYRVYKGQVQKGCASIESMEKETENFSAPVFFSADFEQEMKLVLAPGDLNLSSSDFLPSVPLPVRMAGAMNDPFQKLKREQIQFIALSPLQMISLATSLIPFLEHDDANRALMGSNMQRQAVPIIRPERAIVGTGLESLVVAESGQALESKKSGLVIYCSSERIVLHRLESFPSFKTFQGPLWKKKFNSFEKLILSLSLRPASLCMYAQPKGVTASLCMYAQPEGVREKPVANLLEKRKESGEGDLLKPFFKKQFKSRGAEKIINKGGGTKGLEKFKKTNYQLNRLVYHLDLYERSNQETCLSHRPAAREGDWIQKGDLLADCSASLGGELALGRNLMIAYIPWEGYNFEDAIVASQRLVSEDLFTSIHIEKHDVEISESKRGFDVITQDVPYITRREKRKLDSFGLIKVGQWVDEGDILVGKVASIKPKPLSPHQKLAFDLARLKPSRTKDTSLRVPKGVHGRIIRVEVLETAVLPHTSELISALEEEIFLRKIFKLKEKIYKNQFQALFYFRFFKRKSKSNLPLSKLFQPFKKGESQKNLLNLKKISKSKNGVGGLTAKLLAQRGGRRWSGGEKRNANPFQLFLMHLFHLFHLRWKRKRKWQSKRGGNSGKDFQYSSSKALQNSLLFQSWYSLWFSKKKISNFKRKGRSFLSTLQSKKTEFFLEIYLPFSKLVRLDITKRKKGYVSDFNGNNLSKDEENERVPTKVRIYLAERRKIQVGDKVAGRHGNKGILSVLLGEWDMPYLPDGKPLDMILNPLGVPSRMNVGQVFECLLGLAGDFLNQQYKIPPFDEMYGAEASRSLVYLKLYQARLKSGQHWLFYPTKPGKTRITDGRTGQPFYQFVTVGSAYIIKLVHLVDEKIHARSTGPYSLVTKQPLGGRSKHGGQRLGEMEVWALEGFGAAYTLQEMLTSKSDDVLGRQEVLKAILSKKGSSLGNPEAFKVLVRELQSLCLDIRVSILTGSPMRRKQVDISQVP